MRVLARTLTYIVQRITYGDIGPVHGDIELSTRMANGAACRTAGNYSITDHRLTTASITSEKDDCVCRTALNMVLCVNRLPPASIPTTKQWLENNCPRLTRIRYEHIEKYINTNASIFSNLGFVCCCFVFVVVGDETRMIDELGKC